MRPPTFTRIGFCSNHSGGRSPYAVCSWSASASRRKSLGNAVPRSRSLSSFARRSAISLFSSTCSVMSQPLLQARFQEGIETAVEHARGVADFDVGAQILDARLVQHVGADLV